MSLQIRDCSTQEAEPLGRLLVEVYSRLDGFPSSTFDKFARPLQTTRFSNLTGAPNSRTDVTTYADREDLWVLGQVVQVVNTNLNRIVEKTGYHTTTALPTQFYSPGTVDGTSPPQLLQTLTYNADGTINTAKDGRNNITTLSNWYRGVPKNISFPDGTAQSAVVNSLGQITSVTEQIGPLSTNTATTSYLYDNGGRLTKVTYPTGDATAWAAKNIAFVQVAASEYGIPAGHWRQTISHGNYRKYVYFDAMWRPVLEREHDITDIAGTDRFKRFAYHDSGELAFASYPGTSSTLTSGLWHYYDVLGRPTRTEQDSENGTLVTQYAYLSGFQTRVTNPRGYRTETRFQAFDQPSTDTPIEIIAAVGRPEQQTTLIAKNVLGQTEALTRSGTYGGSPLSMARQYVYDEQLRLCMRKEPETNTTVYGYDLAGNVSWYAEGRPTNAQTCAATRGGVPISAKTQNTYDSRNRVTLVNYPGTAVDIGTTYYADGQVNAVTAGTSVLTYQYNKRRLLTSEQTQTPFINWTTTHSYSNLGHLGATTYPNGHAVSFAPNALGQATQAGTYATAATYFPNGALKSFTYGNGLQHTLTLNTRQLPERSRDALGANVVLDDTYDYDNNGNVAGITDGLPLQPGNRDMTYDALDRLVGVVAGPEQGGNGVFAYDPLDNIRQLDQGTRTGRHQYDEVTNRLTALKNAAGTTLSSYLYDDRGNLASRTEGGQTYTFTFDTANRLTATSLGASSYEYDGLGRRTRETSGGLATYYQYSRAGQLLYAEDYKTARSHLYIYLSGSLVAKRTLAHADGSLQYTYQHTDALGSLVAASDAGGAVQRRERMTAYGEPADGTWANGHGFTGHQNDAATKLVYMQQRYYDPATGRFYATDPIGSNAYTGLNFNRYAYAKNSPFTFLDPDGRYACKGSESECANLRGYVKTLKSAHESMESGEMKQRLGNALAQIGEEDGTGLTFQFGTYDSLAESTAENLIGIDSKKLQDATRAIQGLNVGAKRGFVSDAFGAGIVAHEVSHNLDRSSGEYHPVYFPWRLRGRIVTEGRAYNLESAVNRALGLTTDLNWDSMNPGERILAVSEAVGRSVEVACAGKPTGGGTGC